MKLKMKRLKFFGWEKPDPVPKSLPGGPRRQPTLQETVERALKDAAVRRMLQRTAGVEESADEAMDFDIEGDPIDHLTRFEHAAYELPPSEFKKRVNEALVAKPGLGTFVRRAFGHLFGSGELPADPMPASKPADPKQPDLPAVPPTPEVKPPVK